MSTPAYPPRVPIQRVPPRVPPRNPPWSLLDPLREAIGVDVDPLDVVADYAVEMCDLEAILETEETNESA